MAYTLDWSKKCWDHFIWCHIFKHFLLSLRCQWCIWILFALKCGSTNIIPLHWIGQFYLVNNTIWSLLHLVFLCIFYEFLRKLWVIFDCKILQILIEVVAIFRWSETNGKCCLWIRFNRKSFRGNTKYWHFLIRIHCLLILNCPKNC